MLLTRTLLAAVLCFALSPAQAKHTVRSVKKAEPSGRMVASVYWEGTRVATGRKFDPNGMTVAHKSLPLGTRLVVSYGRNFAEVVVNDRGPYVRGREIDLTRGVAHALHFSGLGNVRVDYWPPLPRPRPVRLSETD
jgi:rare lipoprotein A (peptidoglycan hydrolase)